MKKKQALPVMDTAHPRSTYSFFGHREAEAMVLDSYNSGRMPHAWLISGSKGIGKATFAYRLARFLLSHPQMPATSLEVAENHPISRRITQKSAADLMVLEEPFLNDKGTQVKELPVSLVREMGQFLRLSSGESPYRIVIIDSVDDMNASSANALLKLLEEPPSHVYLLLISHNPGTILPTLRSRCRQLKLQPPTLEDASKILQLADPSITQEDSATLLQLASNSPGRAVIFAQHGALAIYRQMLAIIDRLPQMDAQKIISLGESLANKDNEIRWQIFSFLFLRFIHLLTKAAAGDAISAIHETEQATIQKLLAKSSLEKWLDLWEKSNHLIHEATRAHLDRKQICLLLFQTLSL